MIQIQNLTKRFGGLVAVNDVSFDVPGGSITSVIGPNGAGKTTLFNLVSGLLPPSNGRVIFKETDITGRAPHFIASLGIGRTFQNARLFPNLSVIENVIVGRFCRTHSSFVEALVALPRHRRERRESRERAEELLREVGLWERRLSMPADLPYGDQRRAEVARALATDPDLIMLDEPTAGMTRRESEDLLSLIEELNRGGKTILLIEHNMRLVMSGSHHVVVLNFGRKIAEGAPDQVRRNEEVLEAYLGEEAV